jgi:hypothetical protein
MYVLYCVDFHEALKYSATLAALCTALLCRLSPKSENLGRHYVKKSLHCTNLRETRNSSTALLGDLRRISLKSVKEYRKYCKLIYALKRGRLLLSQL